jgi:flagellar hook protein FlgE
MPFRIALSGLNAASSDLKVTGNNIANASTNGFKSSRAEFADVYATSLGGVSNTAVGGGVRLAQVSQQFAQGNIEFTSNNLDLAISGEGFYVLEDNGSRVFTRAGAFSVDRDGYVVNSTGQRLQVFEPIGNSATAFNTGSLENPAHLADRGCAESDLERRDGHQPECQCHRRRCDRRLRQHRSEHL